MEVTTPAFHVTPIELQTSSFTTPSPFSKLPSPCVFTLTWKNRPGLKHKAIDYFDSKRFVWKPWLAYVEIGQEENETGEKKALI